MMAVIQFQVVDICTVMPKKTLGITLFVEAFRARIHHEKKCTLSDHFQEMRFILLTLNEALLLARYANSLYVREI